MGSNSRYDRGRPVGDREAAEARALHLIGELVRNYPGISNLDIAGQVAHVLHATANELGNGRPVPIEIRRAVRGLADALRREMQPPSTQGRAAAP
jgi:hypothetical protein